MITTSPMNKSLDMQLSVYNLTLSSEIKAGFRRAKSGREVRICIAKAAKSLARQMNMFGMQIRKVEPIIKVLKSTLQKEGMAQEAVEVAEVATGTGEEVILSESAEVILAPLETTGEIAVEGTGFNPIVIVIVIVVIAVAYWYFHGQVQTHEQKFLLENEYRKLHRKFMKLYNNRS